MKKFLFVSALALSSIAVSALAVGTHADGHDHAEHASTMGKAGDPAKVTRTVTIDMTDAMRFTPAKITVEHGETVRFIVSNSGVLKHEMVLGSMQQLKQHAELMRKMPEMEHAEENM